MRFSHGRADAGKGLVVVDELASELAERRVCWLALAPARGAEQLEQAHDLAIDRDDRQA